MRQAPSPLCTLSPDHRFETYRRMVTSPRDEKIHWWYFGTVVVSINGLPPMSTINAATLMVYRTETLSPNCFAIHWDEVGYFTDYVSEEPMDSWLNPLSGERVASPRGFAEGPARYEVTRADNGLTVTLSQPGATVNSIDLTWRDDARGVQLVQRERKTRGFPEIDGRLPDPHSSSGFEAVTELAFLDRPGSDGSATEGLYTFALAGAPPWMRFDPTLHARATVHGVIKKAAPTASPRRESMRILQAMFPEFFARQGD